MTDTLPELRTQLRHLQQQHACGALDAGAFETARLALEAQVVDAVLRAPGRAEGGVRWRWPAAGAGLLAVVAAAVYAWPRTPAAAVAPVVARAAAAPAAAPASAPHTVNPAEIEAMLAPLVARLQAQPGDAEGWAMLARSYMAAGRHADAVRAFERLGKLRPDDADTLADHADALAVQAGRRLEGPPLQLLQRALQLQPGHLKTLTLLGTAAYNRGDFTAAVGYWDRAVQAGPAGHPLVETARGGAIEARERGRLPPGAP